MVSYVPKRGKAVIMLSTMHHDKSVNENSEKKKPEVIEYYNKTKIGGDLMDQWYEHTPQEDNQEDGQWLCSTIFWMWQL